VDPWDSEGCALAIYAEGGIDPAYPTGPHALALAILGRGGIEYARMVGDGSYNPHGAKPRIYLKPGMHPWREAFTIYHELGERHLYGQIDEGIEMACDRIASFLRAPRAAFRRLVHDVGPDDFAAIARRSASSETSAAMRVAEVYDVPTVVVTPARVYIRGAEWGWPDEAELRRLARARKLPSEVEKVTLTDARGRVVIRAR